MWYIGSRFSQHVTGDKDKLMYFNEIKKEKNVIFQNNSPTTIKGK